jgi:hypothetical protein
MAEFQWWLLLVGLVAGGALVAVVSMDGKRREQDLEELERRAETNWIAERLAGTEQWLDAPAVDAVLRLHREYLGMPPPDAILVEGEAEGELADDAAVDQRAASYGWLDGEPDLDRDPDHMPDDVRDAGGSRTDQDLARSGEQQAAAGEEAHAGANREQRADR